MNDSPEETEIDGQMNDLQAHINELLAFLAATTKWEKN